MNSKAATPTRKTAATRQTRPLGPSLLQRNLDRATLEEAAKVPFGAPPLPADSSVASVPDYTRPAATSPTPTQQQQQPIYQPPYQQSVPHSSVETHYHQPVLSSTHYQHQPYTDDWGPEDEEVKEVTVLGNYAFGQNMVKLCVIFMLLCILLISGITALVIASTKHSAHSGAGDGLLLPTSLQLVKEQAFSVASGNAKPLALTAFYYELTLTNDDETWLTLPPLNTTTHRMVSYDVCCLANKEALWICSNGHFFSDLYMFEAKFKQDTADNTVQCLIYTNSKHMLGSSCTVEVKARALS